MTAPAQPATPGHTGAVPASGTAACMLVATLVAHGVDRVFGVAGESYLAVLDALYDAPVDTVTCRHEGSAGLAALGDAKLTGRAGVLLVNRAPGAMNAALSVYAAAADAVPLVLVVGQARRSELDGPAFQELDATAAFGAVTKGVFTVHTPERAAELTARALRVAEQGTPGPTVLVVPEDVLALPAQGPVPPRPDRAAVPAPGEVLADALATARRPLLLLGSGTDRPGAPDAARAAAERHGLAVACTAKRQHLFDNTDPHYAGHLHIATPAAQRAALARADVILALGTRLDAVTTRGFSVPQAPVPAQRLIQVHADPAAIGRVYTPSVGVAADPLATLRALAATAPPGPDLRAARVDWVAGLHDLEVAESTWDGASATDGVVFGDVVAALDRATGGTATIAVDAGNFTSWLHRHYRFRAGSRLLGIAPGAMGFGVPAGLAAALRHPDRPAVVLVGDGGVLMTGAELATAAARRARLCVVVADNGSYGTIRGHQERSYPGRVIATDLANPDFAAWARAHGALGLAVHTTDQVAPALHEALAHDGPSVVAVRTSLTHISAYGRIS